MSDIKGYRWKIQKEIKKIKIVTPEKMQNTI